MDDSRDDRSALAQAWGLATMIVSLSLEMVVPMVLGYWLDRYLGLSAAFVVLGGVVGMWLGLTGLLRLTATMSRRSGRSAERRADREREPSEKEPRPDDPQA